jgi:hypothetical protein
VAADTEEGFALGMFEMSDQQVAEFRSQVEGYAREKVTDEPVVAAALFRRGGAATRMGISYGGLGGLAYAASALFSKKQAGGLPDKALFVATPTKVRAFKARVKGRGFRIGDEVAVWDRAGLKATTEAKAGLTMLTLESPSEGEKVTVAPIGVKDDPVSVEFGRALVSGATEPSAT